MRNRIRRLLPASIALSVAFLVPGIVLSDTGTAQQAFENANSAFRSGDHELALAGYDKALANGKDDARLFYNMGLTHYHLGQYAQARSAFIEAAQDEEIAPLAQYQLGVIAVRNGDIADADRWFRRAHRGANSAKLREMSAKALESIKPAPTAAQRPKAVPASGFDGAVSVGWGTDSNAYRAPTTPYTDLSQNPPVAVVPIEQSGAYVPLRVNLEYVNLVSDQSALVTEYRHRGNYYSDDALENANETDHRVKLTYERALGDGTSTSRQFRIFGEFRSHAETNFDPDDGLDRFDDGASIADRYDYNGLSAGTEYRNRAGRMRYEIQAGFLTRDYEDIPTASSYDLSAYWLSTAVKYPVANNARIKLGFRHFARTYDERRARDATGDASFANPTLEYDYNSLSVGFRHRPSNRIEYDLEYSVTKRNDKFVGYNDYNRDRIKFETTIDFSDRVATQIRVDYRDQQYDNAFAFNDPTQAQKEYQKLELSLAAIFRMTDTLSLKADVEHVDLDSSDPRGIYERLRAGLGIRWSF